MMEILKELETAKAKVVQLEQSLESEMKTKLAALPGQFGFSDMDSFIALLRKTAKAGTAGKTAKSSSRKGPKPAGKTRKRGKVTPELKEKLKDLVKDGKTGAEIAKTLGVSLPTVQNIKKELGLVKARK